MLKLRNVSKFYGHFCALDSLSIRIDEGALYGFIGPNGAGKTTAIKIMTGIMYPDEGEVTINNMRMEDEPEQYKSMIGYVPDSFGMYNNIRVKEYLQFFAACCGKDAVAAGIKAGDIVRAVSAVAGGKGGGKPDSAMGGGTDVLKMDNALAIVDDLVAEKLGI